MLPRTHAALALANSAEVANDALTDVSVRAQRGDMGAFVALVAETTPKLFRVAARILGDVGEAEDALQDAYLRAYDALSAGRFDGNSAIETWLYRIVANVSLDALRARKRRRTNSDVGALEEESTVDDEARLVARRALRELDVWLQDLPADQRTAIVLKELEGLSSNEIAEIMKCSVGAVEQRLVRARTTLRQRSESSGK